MKTLTPYEEMPDILTVDEAAELLRLSRSSTYEAIHERVIPSVRIGRRILIPKSGLRRFIETNATP